MLVRTFQITTLCCLFLLLGIAPLRAQPTAEFTSNVVSGCGKATISFSNLSANALYYTWIFGDHTANSIEKNPVHGYVTPGIYTVTLIASDGVKVDTIVKTNYITIHAPPVSNFSLSDTTGCPPATIVFTDLSKPGSGVIKSWSWDLGTALSSAQHPVYTYNTSGTFQISLTVTDQNGCSQGKTKNSALKLVNASFKPDFSVNIAKSCEPPLVAEFTNLTAPNQPGSMNYTWNFGDGATSNSKSPVVPHTYDTSGKFPVSLEVESANCRRKETKNDLIAIGTPKADFSASKRTGCAPFQVKFSDKSSGYPTKWIWDFGDGSTSTQQNPVHVYKKNGSYHVQLIVSNNIGCSDTAARSNFITVQYDASAIAFNSDKTIGCGIPHTFNFTSSLPADIKTATWNFGDNSTSSEANPAHQYMTADTFSVTLSTVSDSGCMYSITSANLVITSDIQADFSSTAADGCIPLTVAFYDLSKTSSVITDYAWSLGPLDTANTVPNPLYNYTDTGVFDVSLTITDTLGCSVTAEKKKYIQAGMIPEIVDFEGTPLSGCHPLKVSFKNLSSPYADKFAWSPGDGKLWRNKEGVYEYRDTLGTMDVSMTAYHHNCPSTTQKSQYIEVQPANPRFYADQLIGCDTPFTTTFYNTSQQADMTVWLWGDGSPNDTTFAQNTIDHTYSNSGFFDVSIIVFNQTSLCVDTLTKLRYISISRLVPAVEVNSSLICIYDSINFTDHSFSNNKIVQWIWDFRDGSVKATTATSVWHQYKVSMSESIRLTLLDALGCDTTYQGPLVAIAPLPVPSYTVDTTRGCEPLDVRFTDLSPKPDTASLASWIWDFGNGDTSHLQHPVQRYRVRGAYTTKLSITDSRGCDSSLTRSNFINPSYPYPALGFKDRSCFYDTIAFTNQTTGVGIRYVIDFGDGNKTDTLRNPLVKHHYLTDTTRTFNLLLTCIDTNQCDSSMLVPVTVSRPLANFYSNKRVADCPEPAFQVVFLDSSTADIQDNITWDFGDPASGSNNTGYGDTSAHSFKLPGYYDITMTATNTDGCSDTIKKANYIFVDGPAGKFRFTPTEGCSPVQVEFEAYDTANIAGYLWIFQDGNTAFSADTTTVSHRYTYGGNYNPVLIIQDAPEFPGDSVCRVPLTAGTQLQLIAAGTDFKLVDSVCLHEPLQLKDTSWSTYPIDRWRWDFGDGDTSHQQHPAHAYTATGNYNITLEITVDTCTFSPRTQAFTVNSLPSAQYGLEQNNSNYYFSEVTFVDSSLGSGLSYTWSFGNGDSSTAQNPFYKYDTEEEGIFTSSLRIISEHGCKDSITQDIVINRFLVPNAFTPDHDGFNDLFPEAFDFKHLLIINRWGQTLYEGDTDWDGSYDGQTVVPGTYFYILTLVDRVGNEQVYKGPVTVVAK